MKTRLLPIAGFLALSISTNLPAADTKLIVHEWGTFTSLQDEKGEPIGGINTNDEPVPRFVRRLADGFLLSPSEAPPTFFQGAPQCHPDVTMRLETPVLYFYKGADWKPQPIDVHVAFRGGWLTEYYPSAQARAPGFDAARPDRVFEVDAHDEDWRFSKGFGHLRADAHGELIWKGLTLGADGAGPETDAPVWLAPRAVKSSMLQTPRGEREKFLFYRGVANARAALQVVRNDAQKSLEIRDDPYDGEPKNSVVGWLVEVREDGQCAFRWLDMRHLGSPRIVVPASFVESDFAAGQTNLLQEQMRSALVRARLYADEADALLRTWEISYFKAPGLRLFYICPDVDRLLPLRISVPAEITRVMIGRIEIVTPRQRALLAKIAAGPALELSTMRGVTGDSQSDFFKDPENMRRWNEVMEGRAPYRALGLPIPDIYAAYLQLGRFRNALILDEQARRPTPALKEYISKNLFEGYKFE